MSHLISRRYARALLDAALEAGRAEAVYRDTKALSRLIDDSLDLREFFDNPIVPIEKRRRILENLFNGRVDSLTYRFLLFLEEKGRLILLGTIARAFEGLYLEHEGVAQVRITASREMTDHQVDEIVKHLQERLGTRIDPRAETDSRLLGGVKIQRGDLVYDYSLRSQMEKFRKKILGAGNIS